MSGILIIEDDVNINNLLKEALEKENYITEQAFSGTEAKLLIDMKQYALILLDLMLPGLNGEEVLAFIREKGNTPVIVLTAKDSLENKLDLLGGGADDYITKPFEIKEVLARIQVQLRHCNGAGYNNSAKDDQECLTQYKDIVLNREEYSITINGEELSNVTKQEFLIIELMVKHPNKVFTKEEIFEYAWESEYLGETKTLDVHISNIRKKMKKISELKIIKTIWGIGYKLY